MYLMCFMSKMAASRARTASDCCCKPKPRTKMKIASSRAASERRVVPQASRDLVHAVRRASLRTTGSKIGKSIVVSLTARPSFTAYYAVTVQNEGTRGYFYPLVDAFSKRSAGGCSSGSYAALLARPPKEHFVRKTRPVWSAVAAAARARRSGELERPLVCWKGGQRTP